ncbi:MAG: NAD(P)/FAD-dependent oxidoreductase [Thermodesulfovibrionales bacterium]
MAPRSVKVLVAGGGPAGSAAAAVLGRAGADVLLVEKDLSFAKPCGGGVPAPAFREFGLPEECAKHRIGTVRLVAPSGRFVDIRLAEDIFIVERGEFDAHLRGIARGSGAEVVEADLLSVEKTGKRCLVRLRQGRDETSCEAEYVIAADGVNSRVRASLGMRPAASDTIFALTGRFAGAATDRCEFWFSRDLAPGMYAWIFPGGSGVSLGAGGPDAAALRVRLSRFRERAGLTGDPESTRMYRIPVWRDGPYHRGNVLFCGDAAGQVMPLSYEGIYYAMKAGACAAEAVLSGNAAGYRKRWKAEFGRIFLLASKMNAYFLRDDASAERLVALHERPEVQAIAQDLWLYKRHRGRHLLGYVRQIGKLFR